MCLVEWAGRDDAAIIEREAFADQQRAEGFKRRESGRIHLASGFGEIEHVI